MLDFEEDDDNEVPFKEILEREIVVESLNESSNSLFILDIEPSDEKFVQEMIVAATLTPLFIDSSEQEPEYNPVIIGTGEKGVDTLQGLTPREVITISPESLTSALYTEFVEHSSGCFMVGTYAQALAIAPAASLTGMPVLYSGDETLKDTVKTLDIKFAIVIGDTKAPDMVYARIDESLVNQYHLDLLGARGMSSDYIVVTNPDDIIQYSNMTADGKLPVVGLSLLSAQLAAYRRAPVFFSQGLPFFDIEYGDGFTQLGVSRELNNQYADLILEQVLDGMALLENNSMEAAYLALVGGPVTLPMYSWDINEYNNLQYTPCDYYYGDINEDPYQELAVGRIFARSLTDASLLLARTLGFQEIKDYDYPKDASSTIYDSVSEDWKENSLACVGTTKIGPFPGILTPTLANQTATMTEAGYHVTSMGYDLATQAEIVREIIDEMNYAVYYGHGGYDCWYSSVPDPIDADMINSVDLKPGFGIAMACLTSMTDSVSIDLDQMVSLAFLHSGFVGYIGATRVAYGLYDYEIREDGAICGTGALYLVDVFSQKVCEEDIDVGEAMRQAKNDLIYKDGWLDDDGEINDEVQITVIEYVLYGDPAHNIHVPIHD